MQLCDKCGKLSDTVDNGICLNCARREHCIEEAIDETLSKIKELRKERSGCKFGICDL
jgi:NMD protein affecting ribosome stability and mRNA decay